jgi:hypothetical protein
MVDKYDKEIQDRLIEVQVRFHSVNQQIQKRYKAIPIVERVLPYTVELVQKFCAKPNAERGL